MKVLFVHNDYGAYSGEESVVDGMTQLFACGGYEVCQYRTGSAGFRHSAIGQAYGFAAGIYSPVGIRGLREALRRERPDVVNVHNLFPFISPAALGECRRAGVPVVMTVHNYRLMCPTGLFMREGKPCELCLKKGSEWSCIRHNCEHSFPKSLGYALRSMFARRRGYFRDCVDHFVCLTQFQKDRLVEYGFEEKRISVIPHAFEAPDLYEPGAKMGDYIAYVGRLSYEKGIDLLMEAAARHPNIPVVCAGAARGEVPRNIPDNVTLRGHLEQDELEQVIRGARFIVIPSRCYEGFPMAVLEAARHGKPVIAPCHGGFPEIIGEGETAMGLLFTPALADELARQMAYLWRNTEKAEELGLRAFSQLKRHYDSVKVLDQWSKLFEQLS